LCGFSEKRVIPNPKLRNRNHLYDSLKKTLIETGLEEKGFGLHSFRHSFASHLILAGVDLSSVKKLLGHSSIKQTERYSYLVPTHLSKAVYVPENAFKKASGKRQPNIFSLPTNS